MRSNSVNIILPFTSRTRDSYHTQFYNRNDGAFVRVSVFGKEEHLMALTFAVQDLKVGWKWYRAAYEKEIENEERFGS